LRLQHRPAEIPERSREAVVNPDRLLRQA